jgi:hypothetical protein
MMSKPSTLGGINRLPPREKREIYLRVIPPELFSHFNLSPYLVDISGQDLLKIVAPANSTSLEMSLFHKIGFPDPILYGHLTDTINGQIHVLLYILNDPEMPRFDVDRLPDGTPTKFGILHRNLEAEMAAMKAGLNPGQIRKGPHLLAAAMKTFEEFIVSLGHDIFFAEPLYYHNAVIFERYGFTYQQGRNRMMKIDQGFSLGRELQQKLRSNAPFRQPGAVSSVRLRSWAIHDGIFGEPFTNVTMYKRVGKHFGVSTTDCQW